MPQLGEMQVKCR